MQDVLPVVECHGDRFNVQRTLHDRGLVPETREIEGAVLGHSPYYLVKWSPVS